MVKEISVEDLKQKLNEDAQTILIDCREKDEFDFCRIPGAKLLPLSEFQDRALKELKKDDQIYIHCHHGGRSRKACEYLAQNGYADVSNVAGGIEAWSLNIDSKVPRY